jgi:hypothetical protein
MFRELQVDTSELQRLKGIHIEVTDDAKPALIFTYKKRKMREIVLAVVWWLLIVALYSFCRFVVWLCVAR